MLFFQRHQLYEMYQYKYQLLLLQKLDEFKKLVEIFVADVIFPADQKMI
jgi:hypothetical protein